MQCDRETTVNSVEETQACQVSCSSTQDASSDDGGKFLSTNAESESWYSCQLCGEQCQEFHVFMDHYKLHFCAPEAVEDDANDLKFSPDIPDDTEVNMAENSEQATHFSYADIGKFEQTRTLQADEENVAEDYLHEQKISCSNICMKAEISYQNDDNGDAVKFEDITTMKFSDDENITEGYTHEIREDYTRAENTAQSNVDTKAEVCFKNHDNTADIKSEAVTKLSLYQCMLCCCCFDDGGKLHKHVKKHGAATPFKCSVCSWTFPRSTNLKKHVSAKHDKAKRPFACSKCDFQFPTVIELCEHVKSHQPPFGCYLCSTSYVRFDHLCTHIKIIHCDQRAYKCIYCGQKFKQQHHMKEHVNRCIQVDLEEHQVKPKTKPKTKAFKCKICSLSFRTRDPYKEHMLLKHNVGKWHKCPLCPRKYIYPAYLREHMETHEARKRYACAECRRRFNSRSGLRMHLVWHSGVRNFACDCCGKTFYRRSHLQAHFKIHLR